MNMLQLQSEVICADRTSILCFSNTQQMVVKRPGFLYEHTLICASSPQIFKTTLGEVHVWKFTGYRKAESECAGIAVVARLFEDP